jgi:class 3 adenylate cyclase
VVTCANCGTQNDARRKFCLECGRPLVAACPACGTVNETGAKFCGECGGTLGPEPAPSVAVDGGAAGSRPRESAGDKPIAERRLVSVLFTDLVGFTTLSESLDADDTRDLLSQYFELAREIVQRHGGTIEKFIGDAVMAVWGTPTAHEDDAERAVRSALQLVEAVGRLEARGRHLQARAGVLTGEAAVTIGATGQGMVAGDLVNTASRLQSVAEPGTILVGEATYRAASGAIAFEEAGERSLKGKESPVSAWRALAVVARRGGEGRSATLEPPFVGRDEELRLLKEQFHATERDGRPRLVTIVGQAGIGKSRLAWELEKYLDGVVDTILWHEGRSPSYGEGISYWALAEIVRGRSGIAESDDQETARRQLVAMLAEIVPDQTERRWIEPRLAGLLGLEELPVESREELFAAWRTFFERLSEQSPALLVFWDLQWADQGLLDFIEHLLTWARNSPIFVLAEARPELFERRPSWGAMVRSATSIHLEPLGDADMRALLAGLVPGLPEQAMRAIIDRAEGVPLYAVETLRMLIDRGALRPDGETNQFELVVELPDLAVPETLQALIAARLDALPPEDRGLLIDAAVLGLSFTVPSLQAITALQTDEVLAHLEALVKHQLLALDADPRSPERGQYRFIQGVVREVAYQSLAKRDRRAKHLATARYFESLGDDELAGVQASHYLAAYQATPAGDEADALAAQARVALRAAADRAAALHSPIAALGYLDQAITVTRDPRELALLHARAASVATTCARMTEAIEHAHEGERAFASLGDRLGVLQCRALEAAAMLAEHGDKKAIAILLGALGDVADLPPAAEIALAQSELARALMLSGSTEAVAWADKVLATPALVSANVLVETLITRATVQVQAGNLIEAEVGLRGAIAVADRLGDRMASLRARNNLLGIIDPVNLEDALALNNEIYEIAQRFGERTWVQQALGVAVADGFEIGRWDEWIAEIRDEEPQAAEYYRLWFRAEEAHRLAYRGHLDEANEIVEAALSSDVIRGSAQAASALQSLVGEFRMLEGRWTDAFESAKAGWNHTDAAGPSLITSILAAAAASDLDRLQQAIAAADALMTADEPMAVATRQIGAALRALLERRWDEGRETYRIVSRSLETSRHLRVLAAFQLAVGHLAENRFPEAADALREADAFFRERGADGVVPAYRAMAAHVRADQPARAIRAVVDPQPTAS